MSLFFKHFYEGNNKMKKWLLAAGIAILPMLAFADNCDSTRNGYDAVYCDGKVYVNADKELNKNYQELRGQLNNEQKNVLKRSQLAWIKERDQQCSRQSDRGEVISTTCQLNKTQERNSWLRERIRECKTIGCKTSALKDV